MSAQLKKGLHRLNATKMVEKCRHIEEMMTGNVELATPVPALATITAAREALELAITLAMDGSRTAMAERRKRQRELKALLDMLAGYVTSVAEGDELIILSSGFEVRQRPTPVGELPQPVDLQARISDHRGRIDLTWETVRHARSYHVYHNASDPAQEESWKQIGVCGKARYSAIGLESAKVHWFRVVAFGTAGTSPISDVAHSLAA